MKTLTNFVLVCSISFNLAFAGMFIYHRFYLESPPLPPENPFKMLAEHCPGDRPFIKNHERQMHSFVVNARQERRELMKQISEGTNEDEIWNLVESMLQHQNQMERESVRTLLTIRDRVGDDKFQEIIRKNRPLQNDRPRKNKHMIP